MTGTGGMVTHSAQLSGATVAFLPGRAGIATIGLVWTIAGILLLLWGWLSLRRASRTETASDPDTKPSRWLRTLAAALIGGGAAVLGALLSGQGALASQLAAAEISPVLFAFELRESTGFGVLFGNLGAWTTGLSLLGSRIEIGFLRIGAAIFEGIALVGRGVRFGGGLEGVYVVENLAAITAAVGTGAFVGWISWSSRWNYAGVAMYVGLQLMVLGFVAVSLAVVESSSNALAQALGAWLVGAVLFGFVLMLVYQFYVLEHLAGTAGARTAEEKATPPDPHPWPFVLVQVASFNEPPAIVRECLESIRGLDYPRDRYSIQLCDDSTDAATVRALAAACTELGVDFRHRSDRRGFKGGALNDGLRAAGPDVEFVAIVDSDYVVAPAFLRRVVPEFGRADLAFVQTPQAYRNVRKGSLTWWYELADAYFYRVVQPVRARHQSLIFCGTMGVLRRRALDEAGGWSEKCVTEDAELTIRLLARQGVGRYVPEVLGRGLAPDLMTAVRSQQRRWAFGGIQMLRMNRQILTSRKLSLRQRIDFWMTGLFWFDGLFLVGVAAALGGLVVASWFGVWLPYSEVSVPALVAIAPVLLMLDGLIKIRAALGTSVRVRFRDVLGVLTFWYAIKLNDLRAATRAWMGSRIPFVRTPKIPTAEAGVGAALGAALRTSLTETTIAAALLGVVVTSVFLWRLSPSSVSAAYVVFLVWLVYYAYAFASTFWFDFASRLALIRESPRTPSVPPAPVPESSRV